MITKNQKRGNDDKWPLCLGIIGCGAVVEHNHLPAAQRVPEVRVVGLADPELDRVSNLAKRFSVPFVVPDYQLLLDECDAFLVATPPHLHRPIVEDLLNRRKPVLCEKPLTPTLKEAEVLVKAARSNGTTLAIGHNRRFAWNINALRTLLDGGGLGEINSIKVADGFPYGWPSKTNFFLDRAKVGGGVLMENGVHVIDTLLWCFGDAIVANYEDDSLGGLENNARLTLRFSAGFEANIWVSRTCETENCLLVETTNGWAEAPLYDTNHLYFEARRSRAGRLLGPVIIVSENFQDYEDLMAAQFVDFANAVVNHKSPRTSGEEGAQAIKLIQSAYAIKQDRHMPDHSLLPGETW